MRVLIVSPYFPPQPGIASASVFSLARHWADLGDDITVLTTTKRPDQRGLDLHDDRLRVHEIDYRGPWLFELGRRTVKGRPNAPDSLGDRTSGDHMSGDGSPGTLRTIVDHFRQRTGVFGSVRMPDLTDGWIEPAAAWGIEHGGWDAIVSSAGPYTAHLVAQCIRAKCPDAVWFAEFRDLWTGNPVHRGLFPFTMIERGKERRVLAAADGLIAPTAYCRSWLERASPGTPAVLCYNSASSGDLAGLDPAPAFPDDGVFRLVHTGTLYPDVQDAEPLFAGWRRAIETEPRAAEIELVAAGTNADVWRALADRHGLADRVRLVGAVPRQRALRMQRDASALVIAEFTPRSQQGALPGKLFEYLASEAPILVVGGREGDGVVDMVERTGRGVHLPEASSAQAVIAALARGKAVVAPDRADRAVLDSLARETQVASLVSTIRTAVERRQRP